MAAMPRNPGTVYLIGCNTIKLKKLKESQSVTGENFRLFDTAKTIVFLLNFLLLFQNIESELDYYVIRGITSQ